MDNVLAKIDRASRLLAEAKTVQEAKHIADVAEAARIYAKRVEASIITVNTAAEIKIRAERLLGEMLQQTPKSEGARAKGTRRGSAPAPRQPAPLSKLGITKKQSSRSQKLASIPAPQFERTLSAQKQAGKEITVASFLRSQPPADTENDTDEQIWHRGLLYRAGEALDGAAFEHWSHFAVDLQLVNAATRAAEAWKKTADYLRKLHHEQKKQKSRAA